MTRSPSRPMLFCEWAAGTTIDALLGPLPKKKPKRRGVVKVEVTTDDESEEDTLKITYPRSTASPKAPETVVKKVRFEEAPTKSALKKTLVIATETEASANPPSDATSEEPSSESVAEPSSDSSKEPEPPKPKKSKKSKKKPAEAHSSEELSGESSVKDTSVASSDGGSDSEPHPTCECVDCVRGRAKAKKASGQGSKKTKKAKCEKGSDTSEADDEASESAPESAKEEVTVVKKSKKKSQTKPEPAKKKSSKQESPKEDDVIQPTASEKKAGSEKAEERTKSEKKELKIPLRPEAYPLPHPRRPQLIEPIRAEVLQTERVVEGPEDPPPNAFYDPEHNIVRVYYGPVYGNSHGRSLYPRRDPSNRPLPIGMPHPSQNPYYYGFNAVNGQPAQALPEYTSANQGMPFSQWGHPYPPPPQWYQGTYPGGPAQGGPNDDVNYGQGTNKGAFSMQNHNFTSAPSNKENDGQNNVGPASLKSLQDNPYIPKSSKSKFSNFGSNRSASAGSHAGKTPSWRHSNHSNNGIDGTGHGNQAAANEWSGTAQDANTWDNTNPPQGQGAGTPQGQWGTQNNAHPDPYLADSQQPVQEAWPSTGDTNNGNNNQWESTGGQSNENGSTWGPTQAQYTENTAGSQDTWAGNAATDVDNVAPPMPGAWQDSASLPAWCDLTAAADTHGKIDKW